MVKLSSIKINNSNPRHIKDSNFDKLVKSIEDFPKMMKLRPLVVDNNNEILGGNMRFKALQHLGYKEVPDEWIKKAEELTEEEKRQFIIKDNVGFGEWEWEALSTEWDADKLEEWGLELPENIPEPDYEDLIGEDKNKPATLKITFESPEQLQKAEIDIQELIDRKYKGAYFSVSAGEL